jgi:hypothetical protein
MTYYTSIGYDIGIWNTCLVRFRTTVTDHTRGEIRGKVRDRAVVFRGWRERV